MKLLVAFALAMCVMAVAVDAAPDGLLDVFLGKQTIVKNVAPSGVPAAPQGAASGQGAGGVPVVGGVANALAGATGDKGAASASSSATDNSAASGATAVAGQGGQAVAGATSSVVPK